ncbi:MAG: sigma-54-dependent Fis family transcriptional regulator [Desulfobulbaceae bacterium]|nr:sigma-54-dependent Fis family transcriptional regulator [Desulfobulbaceae bacterium]
MATSTSLYPDLPVVVVEDDPGVIKAICRTLQLNGFTNIIEINDSRRVMPLLDEKKVSLMLLDITMPHIRGDELLGEITVRYPQLPVIMATATDDVETVVGCMKKGAFDYITKPISTARLVSAIRCSLEVYELRREQEALRQKEHATELSCRECFDKIITGNRELRKLFNYIEKIAPSSRPVLITGETGVGKELAAEAVHLASGRKGKLVVVNVASLDDNVFSDTLFGHVKGAYTGALGAREGQVKKAEGGTLLLDEIGSLSLSSQVKLLRLIQEREYLPLGADVPLKADVCIFASSNSNLEEKVQQGVFRGDLYFRLKTHTVHLPPLRDRLDDLPLLIDHFSGQAAGEAGVKPPVIPEELYTLLANYSFPGNIRELKSMIDDAVFTKKGSTLSLSSFYQVVSPPVSPGQKDDTAIGNSVTFGGQLPSAQGVRILLVKEALGRSGGNISMAANLIGITRQSLSQFISRNKVHFPDNSSDVG